MAEQCHASDEDPLSKLRKSTERLPQSWPGKVSSADILPVCASPTCKKRLHRKAFLQAKVNIMRKPIPTRMLRCNDNDNSKEEDNDDQFVFQNYDYMKCDNDDDSDHGESRAITHDNYSNGQERRSHSPPLPINLWTLHKVNDKKDGKVIAAVTKLLSSRNLPTTQEAAFHVAQFFLFIHERQCVWVRRKKSRDVLDPNSTPTAFSELPIFQQFSFCNNYRELDYGTRYFRSQMMLRWEQEGLGTGMKNQDNTQWMETVLFASFVYRQINRVDTFLTFGGGIPTTAVEWETFTKWATSWIKENKKNKGKNSNSSFFTAAHQTTNWRQLQLYVKKLLDGKQELLKNIAKQLVEASSSQSDGVQKCYDIFITNIYGCGPFFAWQIVCDLLECKCLGSRCNDNQWTMLGPGAKNGIRAIFPRQPEERELELAIALTKLQSPVLKNVLGLDFCKFQSKQLSLKNIEHALCEYCKFLHIKSSMNRRRKFKARKWTPNPNHDTGKTCSGCKVTCTTCDTCCDAYCDSCAPKSGVSGICQRCIRFEAR